MARRTFRIEMNVHAAMPGRVDFVPIVLIPYGITPRYGADMTFQTYAAAEAIKVLVEIGVLPVVTPGVQERPSRDCRICVSRDDGRTWAYCDGPDDY